MAAGVPEARQWRLAAILAADPVDLRGLTEGFASRT